MLCELRHSRLWIGLGLAFVALVIYLSLTPDPIEAPKWGAYKGGHIMAYAWLMFYFAQVCGRVGERLVIAVLLVAMGVGLEYVQDWVGRDFAYSDMRDDAIGVAGGFVLALTPLGSAVAFIEERMKA